MYLETPEFLYYSLHFISVLAFPIHALGAYCILCKTPKTMNSMKWSLFYLHVWCMIQDWSLTILIAPILNFPSMSGYGMGLLTWLNVPQIYQNYLLMTLMFVMCVAIVLIFENRYYQLFAQQGAWRRIRSPFIIINYTLAFTCFIPIGLAVPDQKIEVEKVLKRIPNLSPEIDKSLIFVLSNDLTFVMTIFSSMLFFMLIEAIIFIILIHKNINLSSKLASLSETTIRLQKNFLKSIYIQITVFLVTIQLPMVYIIISIVFDYYSPFGNNMLFITLAIHGMVSTLIMLWAHKPYREASSDIIQCKLREATGTMSTNQQSMLRNANLQPSVVKINN